MTLIFFFFALFTDQSLAAPFETHEASRTLETHDAAHDHNVPRTPLLHVGHHFLDHANNAEEVGLENAFHLVDADALHRSQQAHTCIVD